MLEYFSYSVVHVLLSTDYMHQLFDLVSDLSWMLICIFALAPPNLEVHIYIIINYEKILNIYLKIKFIFN